MPDSLVEQFRDELDQWEQTLQLYEGSITGLESRLYMALQRDAMPALARQIEDLFNQLLLLRSDISILFNALEQQGQQLKKNNHPIENNTLTVPIIETQDTLRNQMQTTRQDFADQKSECEAFLAGLPE